MIKLQISKKNIDQLNRELSLKVEAIGELTRGPILNDVAQAAFVILGKRFLMATDTHARLNPKKMHHVYEWGKAGDPSSRLFVLEKSAMVSQTLVISSKFIESKTFVPIPKELQVPGINNRSVTSRHIFRNKAEVMEKGLPVRIESRKMLAFMGRRGIRFIQPGQVNTILNPGGREVRHSFEKFMQEWYSSNAQSIIDSSGLYDAIVKETAIVLNKNGAGMTEVRKAVKQVVNSVTKGMEVVR
jgi:hypothetical protein